MSKRILLPLLALVPLAGCVRYRAKPIEPSEVEHAYRARSLADPGLREFAAGLAGKQFVEWPPAGLDLDVLWVVAMYYSPELDVARAQVQGAEAAVLSARGSINPSLSFGAGYESGPEAPLIFHFDPTLTLVTAGKKGHRILEAEKLSEVSRIRLRETGWRLRSRLRSLLIDQVIAARAAGLLRLKRDLRAQRVGMLDKRLVSGELSRPEAVAGRIELSSTDVALRSAEGAESAGLAALADALGMPASALSGSTFILPCPEKAPHEDDLALDRIQKAGLLNRLDVRRALLEYAAAEAGLRLEVARQYPDIEISPGYSYDEGHHKIQLGPGLTIPYPNRNRGPIAEAESRRLEAETRFAAVQAAAIAEIDTALRAYRADLSELTEAEKLIERQSDQVAMTVRAVELGEVDGPTLTAARIDRVIAEATRLAALRKLQLAYGAVEDAVQQPLRRGPFSVEVSPAFPRGGREKENQP